MAKNRSCDTIALKRRYRLSTHILTLISRTKTYFNCRRKANGNQTRMNKSSRNSPTRRNRSSSRHRSSTPRSGWLWRVVRIALPIQAALLLLFCVSCLLEPSCCDSLNNLNMDLGPQARYIHGQPPV